MEEEKFEVRDLRKKDKFMVDDAFLNGYARIVGIYATGVYLCLCRHADKDQKCYPSIKKIAEELNISKASVFRALNILEKHNIIKRERVGKRSNNRYYLLDKKHWVKSPTETSQSDVSNRDITSLPQRHHWSLTDTSNSKETHSKETHVRNNIYIKHFEDFKKAKEILLKGMEMFDHQTRTFIQEQVAKAERQFRAGKRPEI